jgi:hypothetical protein
MGFLKMQMLELHSKLIAQLIMIYKTVNNAIHRKRVAIASYSDITVVTCWH